MSKRLLNSSGRAIKIANEKAEGERQRETLIYAAYPTYLLIFSDQKLPFPQKKK